MNRDCPICQVPLLLETYEGFGVLRCPECQGHLVELARYETIRRLPRTPLAELEAEARDDFHGDYPDLIRCPRCHAVMTKQPLQIPGFDLNLDLCRGCTLAWFDGGELALAQLGYQATPAHRDREELRRRAVALQADPQRQAAFEKAVAQMPLEHDTLSQALKESVLNAVSQILFRVTLRWPL